jgi:hypothetical protein
LPASYGITLLGGEFSPPLNAAALGLVRGAASDMGRITPPESVPSLPVTARPANRLTFKAQLKVNDDDPDEVTAELTLSPYVKGPVFDPDPDLDAKPTGFLDKNLSIASIKVEMPPWSGLKVKEHLKRVSYIHAARTRILVARFRLLYTEFRSGRPEDDLIRYVAETGRLYQQTERMIIVARVFPFAIGVAIVLSLLAFWRYSPSAPPWHCLTAALQQSQ